MITLDARRRFCTWEQSTSLRDLYSRRCRKEAEEMTAHAQAAELLTSRVTAGDTLLDAGCGSGYFFHSLASRGLDVNYTGIDAAPSLIDIGRREMPSFGLAAERLQVAQIEDLDGEVDHVVCINVLTNIDNFHRPLERLLRLARRSVILRESMKQGAYYSWVRDYYLDPGVDLSVHVNHYDIGEMLDFVRTRGFQAEIVVDRRSGGKPENVIDHPHYWTFLVADRVSKAG